MRLTRYKIGELIELIDERNSKGLKNFFGINIEKEFIHTQANTEGLDESKYKILKKNRFVFSGMQTGRDNCIRIGMYNGDEEIIVSPAYSTFEIRNEDKIIPMYFFMIFISKEKDRYGAFCSDGSIRSNLDWSVFCDMEVSIPSISIQQKYVDIYNAMIENQKSYEKGLENLKLVCDAMIYELQKSSTREKLGQYIEAYDIKNVNNEKLSFKGLSMENYFIDSIANTQGLDFSKYKVVYPKTFGAVLMKVGRDKRITIAQNNSDEKYMISSAYFTFKAKNINEDYLMMIMSTENFDLRCWFNSDSSVRGSLDWEGFCDVEIPVARKEIQNSLAKIHSLYLKRKEINEKLKQQIKDICPILIKGSIEEARK
ncbi:hypothetical protein ACWOBP_05970 [Gemella parahaemolysans]|jgi:restriction endonuclease, S subunit